MLEKIIRWKGENISTYYYKDEPYLQSERLCATAHLESICEVIFFSSVSKLSSILLLSSLKTYYVVSKEPGNRLSLLFHVLIQQSNVLLWLIYDKRPHTFLLSVARQVKICRHFHCALRKSKTYQKRVYVLLYDNRYQSHVFPSLF